KGLRKPAKKGQDSGVDLRRAGIKVDREVDRGSGGLGYCLLGIAIGIVTAAETPRQTEVVRRVLSILVDDTEPQAGRGKRRRLGPGQPLARHLCELRVVTDYRSDACLPQASRGAGAVLRRVDHARHIR